MENKIVNDFTIEIQYNKDSKKPSHVFRVMSDIIESFITIDKALISSINFQIEPVILLEDIEKGSIISRFKYLLENIPDEAVADLNLKKLIGHYLIKAKYCIINFIDKKETIVSTDIEPLEKELLELSKAAQINQLSSSGIIDRAKLLTGMSKISEALNQAEESEKIIYKIDDEFSAINLSFKFTAEQIEDLLTVETITTSAEMILKIKKPDYLGDSKWEFRHRKETIFAKLSDIECLNKFRNREIVLKPGDSFRVNVDIEVKYDYDREVAAINHNIKKVLEIIFAKSNLQNGMFENGS